MQTEENNIAVIGNTVIMQIPFFAKFLNEFRKETAKEASEIATRLFKEEIDKTFEFNIKEAAKRLDVSERTVRTYIITGHGRPKKIKLKARADGKSFKINQYNLDKFRQKMK